MVNADSDDPIFRAFLEQSRPRSEGPVVGFEGNYVQKWAFSSHWNVPYKVLCWG